MIRASILPRVMSMIYGWQPVVLVSWREWWVRTCIANNALRHDFKRSLSGAFRRDITQLIAVSANMVQ